MFTYILRATLKYAMQALAGDWIGELRLPTISWMDPPPVVEIAPKTASDSVEPPTDLKLDTTASEVIPPLDVVSVPDWTRDHVAPDENPVIAFEQDVAGIPFTSRSR